MQVEGLVTPCAIRDCEKPLYQNLVCEMHYWRIRRHGRIDGVRLTPETRFWGKVHKTEGCWLWTGTRNTAGYGTFKYLGKNALAHRIAYQWESGPIQAGLYLDHLCHERRCVRPSHLEPVTPKINAHRSDSPIAANATKTHCMRGHEFTSDNTYSPPGKIQRHCRQCRRELAREVKSQKPKVGRKGNGNTYKTHCKLGHPLSGANLMILPNQRRCRTCHNRLSAEGAARAKARKANQSLLPVDQPT